MQNVILINEVFIFSSFQQITKKKGVNVINIFLLLSQV